LNPFRSQQQKYACQEPTRACWIAQGMNSLVTFDAPSILFGHYVSHWPVSQRRYTGALDLLC